MTSRFQDESFPKIVVVLTGVAALGENRVTRELGEAPGHDAQWFPSSVGIDRSEPTPIAGRRPVVQARLSTSLLESTLACAAARRATGIRGGEHET